MSILKNFIKYQSLGNDFIVFDWFKKPLLYIQNELCNDTWRQFVKEVCNRHFGVGADGVIVITSGKDVGVPEMLIFNADGSQGQNCLNGLRCVAHYLYTTYHFPEQFSIQLGQRTVDCFITATETGPSIVTQTGCADYLSSHEISVGSKNFIGHHVVIGNPHLIIFEPISLEWLTTYGASIEQHQLFTQRINVEFVWQTDRLQSQKVYKVFVYERGCGITLACSSGAAAIVHMLHMQYHIKTAERVILEMLGGDVETWIDDAGSIFLQAPAQQVYKGVFEEIAKPNYTKLSATI